MTLYMQKILQKKENKSTLLEFFLTHHFHFLNDGFFASQCWKNLLMKSLYHKDFGTQQLRIGKSRFSEEL